MNSKESIPLKKVLKVTLGDLKAVKYLQGLDFAYVDSNDIYQSALSNLLNGNTEKTLKAILFGLDLDRENNSIIHLARTMLFSLSEDFYENGGYLAHQKYSNLNKAQEQLSNRSKNLEEEILKTSEDLDIIEKTVEETKKNFFLWLFNRNRLTKNLKQQKSTLSEQKKDFEKIKNEVENLIFLIKIEEFIKVLSVILEVCIFPLRFAWILTAK